MRKSFRFLRYALAFTILAFFVASFFIGIKTNPDFVDIARSPYGLFSYFVITALTAFIPSMVTLPLVTTATVIWGSWVAGLVAIAGWTIGGVIEYYAALFAINSLSQLFDGSTKNLEQKLERVKSSITFWQFTVARLFIPAFVFGLAKTKFDRFLWASILAYIPLAAAGVGAGEFLRAYLDQIQPLLVGGALVLLIFTLDVLFARREGSSFIDLQNKK